MSGRASTIDECALGHIGDVAELYARAAGLVRGQLINEVTQGSSISQSLAEGYRTFESTLVGQQQAVSGVSIDEEAVKMLTLQRIFQASAKYIQTVADLLDMLVKI